MFDTGSLLRFCAVNFGLVDLGVVFGLVVVIWTFIFELVEAFIREVLKALFRTIVG